MLPTLRSFKSFILVAILSLLSHSVFATPYYVVDMDPWQKTFNDSAMDYTYGPGNWLRVNYSTPAATIFTASTPFVMLEGSDMNATALNNFLSANQVLIETWVQYGGRLFINAAPNQGANISMGFNNTVLHYPIYFTSGGAINPSDSIFLGPFTPVATSYMGNYLGHANITGVGLDSLMYGDSMQQLVLARKAWGAGSVYFGGLTQPNWWQPMLEGENLWYNIFNAATIPPVPTDSGAVDSFVVYASYNCSPLQLMVKTTDYYAGMGVKTYFGDNTSDSTAVVAAVPTGGSALFNHVYNTSGTYTIKQVLYNGASVIDSLEFSYAYVVCNTILVSFYYDANNNCIQDGTEGLIMQPSLTEVDSNNVPIDTISSLSGFYYTEYGSVGDVYKFKPLSVTGYVVSCPVTGYLYDTLNVGNNSTLSFGLNCFTGNSFDLAVNDATNSGTNLAINNISVTNAYCTSINGTLTMNYSPDYSYVYASPAPTTNAGQTLTWNLNNISNSTPANIYVYLSAPTLLSIGDTVNYSLSITPITGDTDATNNTLLIVDTILGPFDPNHIAVSPQGYITAGTQLKYSVEFENTGNAPAQNIYVLDTLPDQVDINSFRAVTASAKMITSIYRAGGHNVIKFEFPNINLPDSVHFPHDCTGMFSFTINTKAGLAMGTHIPNDVGIYFDNNPVIMTNSVENIIWFPTNVATVAGKRNIELYPNPAKDELTIKTTQDIFTSFTIANSMGQVMVQENMNGVQTKVNVKQLPAGIYYITLTGSKSSEVRKFVKM